VDQQVNKLVKFVQCQKNTIVRRELETLLPPLVCHLFIEMLKGKECRPAHDFLRKYSSLVGAVQEIPPQKVNGTDPNAIAPQQILFTQNQTMPNFHQQKLPGTSKHQPPLLTPLNVDEQKLCVFRELITNLSCIRRLDDAKDNKLIVNFRSCKYKAQLARKTLTVLNKYLSKHGHVLLIQILHVWFAISLYELHEESNDDSSSSSSDCTILNHFEYSDDNVRHNNKIDRYSDPSHCDNTKDIKFSIKSRFHNSEVSSDMQGSNRATDDVMQDSNMKLTRLRECLHRVDNKYHKPIRIFNINYTENR
jgi:transcription initiation factor TFIID subunit 5